MLVWAKSAFTLGRSDYHWQHEPCLYGWADGAAHLWLGGRGQSTVLAFDRPARNADHPTMKPVALFGMLVRDSCPPGGVVLDPFAGSGTTLVAAVASGRTAAVVELDPAYCDVVCRRFEQIPDGQRSGCRDELAHFGPTGGRNRGVQWPRQGERARTRR